MAVEIDTLASEAYIADLKLRFENLAPKQKEVLSDLANGIKEISISLRLGLDGAKLFREKEFISRAMGELHSRDGVCRAIALGILFDMIPVPRIPNRMNFSLNESDLVFLGYMGYGLSSYEIARSTGMPLDLVNNRRKHIARKIGASTIYQATAVVACAIRQSQVGLGNRG